MSIIEWFRRTFVPLKRADSRFGPMTFQRMSGKYGPSYWEGSGTFAGEEIEYFVDANEEGPSAAQRERATAIEASWRTIEPRLATFLANRVEDAQVGESSRRLADWSLGSLALPANGEDFEIGYVERDGGELLTFEMDGFEPRAARIGD